MIHNLTQMTDKEFDLALLHAFHQDELRMTAAQLMAYAARLRQLYAPDHPDNPQPAQDREGET